MSEPFQLAATIFCALMTLNVIVKGYKIEAVIIMSALTAGAAFLWALPS